MVLAQLCRRFNPNQATTGVNGVCANRVKTEREYLRSLYAQTACFLPRQHLQHRSLQTVTSKEGVPPLSQSVVSGASSALTGYPNTRCP